VPPVAPPASPAAGLPDGTRLVLRARAGNPDGAWIQVRDPRSGQVLVNRVLRPGEAWPVPVRDGLLLDTGKADGLEIILDGQPQPMLDGLVGVRRNIALEPDRVRQRIAPAQAAATPSRS
jgi:cytoskeleton protein RodZ